jgi:hypothetical protein
MNKYINNIILKKLKWFEMRSEAFAPKESTSFFKFKYNCHSIHCLIYFTFEMSFIKSIVLICFSIVFCRAVGIDLKDHPKGTILWQVLIILIIVLLICIEIETRLIEFL